MVYLCTMKISMIVACDLDNGIGLNNALLCHLPADLKYFKNTTAGHCILMGRKTFESIGRPLPNRTNLVLSRRMELVPEGLHLFSEVNEALAFAGNRGEQEIFVIGGGALYAALFERADRIYLTRIHHHFQADTFFPAMDPGRWELVSSEPHQADEKNLYDYTFEIYETKQSTKAV